MFSKPIRILCTLAILVVASSAALAQSVNDNIANATFISIGQTLTGPNAGYGLETGEPVPLGYSTSTYQATAWYELNEPSIVGGWYEVDTVGSTIDTVIAVWRSASPNFAAIQLVHVNDEASTGSGVSRIRFQSFGDTTYYVSVASKTTSRGSLKLTLQPAPDPLVTSFLSPPIVLSPASPDITNAAVSVTTTIKMSISSNIASGSLRVFDPSHYFVTSTSLTNANRTSGTNSSGTYQVSFTLPRYLPPGTYYLAMHLADATVPVARVGNFGWEELSPFPAGVTSSFVVQNTGTVDTYAQWVNQTSLAGLANNGKTQDYDHDGTLNLVEFAFGLDPKTPSAVVVQTSGTSITQMGIPKVTLAGSGASKRLRVEFLRKQLEPLLTYTVRFSNDALTWTNATNSPSVIASGGGYDVVAVEDVIDSSKTRRFAHVLISYALP